jgi:hypothetical protein
MLATCPGAPPNRRCGVFRRREDQTRPGKKRLFLASLPWPRRPLGVGAGARAKAGFGLDVSCRRRQVAPRRRGARRRPLPGLLLAPRRLLLFPERYVLLRPPTLLPLLTPRRFLVLAPPDISSVPDPDVFPCLLPSSPAGAAAAASLQRVEMAAMYAPQDLQEKPDVTKVRRPRPRRRATARGRRKGASFHGFLFLACSLF